MIREAVGSRRSLTFYDDKGNKTLWRMYEYTTNDPNLPVGSDGNKLSDCVLCKVYKKETILTDNNKQSGQVPNERNQEQNQPHDEPPIKRRRVSAGNQANGIEHIPNSKADVMPYQHPVNNIVGFGQPIPPQTLQFNQGTLMHTRTNPDHRGSNSAVEAPFQVFAREQVGPYSDSYGGDTTGRVPNLLTSTESLLEDPTLVTWTDDGIHEDQVTWINNNIDVEQSPLTLTKGPHEDPTLMTSTNNIAEKELPLTTLTHGWHEDPTLLTCTNKIHEEQSPLTLTHKLYEDPTLVTWPESPIEDPTYKTSAYYGFDKDIASLLMNIF
ncbi:putative transcription factor NAM family [Helianthus annuus]|uniref:Transcription factor NAM family n=2 Tax=Helianthus annuus TaxID=4232 RepID=A0A9K3HNX7_HELAN|nr:uncharacterized protein LOC110934029 [Helianthus annuus]KAF5781856.1 putative transcription factor NAM family [Helianthus annuus]KAJ0501404.1 putative transcription factor NAM family [Helianthus annuus]KAJ0509201.1 putative transcription factor NAM family [Helianthus annuus]KAJ0685323.1 putative transcription factor NAM family [Helianthus annuus]KAJ0689228.1 putative transcription factor NAM family [Helianthus annuus]